MKKFSNHELVVIKKLIGLGSAFLCLLMMLFNFIEYTSSSSLLSGGTITESEGVSLINFLFNKNHEVFDGNVEILRDVFGYSYVVMWIVFILSIVSVILLAIGFFMKQGMISKIGSSVSLGTVVLLMTLTFNRYSIGSTVRYLDVFTWIYGIIVIISGIGFVSTITLKDK